jgi:hypothetical protein
MPQIRAQFSGAMRKDRAHTHPSLAPHGLIFNAEFTRACITSGEHNTRDTF